jgi:acyl carrier protein
VTGGHALDFEGFAGYLSSGLRIEAETIKPEARLIEDLGLDSMGLLEMVVLVEELGVRFPDGVVVGFETVGDVYREYGQRALQ